MTPFSDFYVHVVPDAPFVLQPAVVRIAREVSIDFCSVSLAWREYLSFAPTANQLLQTIPDDAVEDGLYPNVVKYYDNNMWGEQSLVRTTVARLTRDNPNWRTTTPGTPTCFAPASSASDSEELYLIPPPTAGAPLVYLDVALAPSFVSEGIPDGLFRRYGHAIVHGVLGRVFAQPASEHTSDKLSNYHQGLYAGVVEAAKLIAEGSRNSPMAEGGGTGGYRRYGR